MLAAIQQALVGPDNLPGPGGASVAHYGAQRSLELLDRRGLGKAEKRVAASSSLPIPLLLGGVLERKAQVPAAAFSEFLQLLAKGLLDGTGDGLAGTDMHPERWASGRVFG